MKNFLPIALLFFSCTLSLFAQPRMTRCGGLNEFPCIKVYDNDRSFDNFDMDDYMEDSWDTTFSNHTQRTGSYSEEPVNWQDPADVLRHNPYCLPGLVIGGPDGRCVVDESRNPSAVTVQAALLHGCNTETEATQILRNAKKKMVNGSRSYRALQGILDSGGVSGEWMTTLDVTDEIMVYRGTNRHYDIAAMMKGELISKAQVELAKKGNPTEFWEQNGPEITSESPKYLRHAFQILACASSISPRSQFVSIALTYEVAAPFASSGYVYRFKVKPMSPILGMKQCSQNKGEVQYQIQGGTKISELARRRNQGWESFDFKTQRWAFDKDELKRSITIDEIEFGGLTWTASNVSVEVPNSICYGSNDTNCAIEGRLYTYEGAALACEKLGPGWRLPSDEDWQLLTRPYGGAYGDTGNGKNAYKVLAKGGSTGFNGSFGGKRFYFPDSQQYYFYDFGTIGYYWADSKDQRNRNSNIGYTFRSSDNTLLREGQPLNTYISCRCVKD